MSRYFIRTRYWLLCTRERRAYKRRARQLRRTRMARDLANHAAYVKAERAKRNTAT
jgi:hypothetical protein